MKSKGYDIARLANAVNVTRVAVEKDLQKGELTRRSLVKYVPILLSDVDEFYGNETKIDTKVNELGSVVPLELYADLQAKYIDQQGRYIQLQADFLELTKRFFLNAVQQATITA
jgi:hypothetical protein